MPQGQIVRRSNVYASQARSWHCLCLDHLGSGDWIVWWELPLGDRHLPHCYLFYSGSWSGGRKRECHDGDKTWCSVFWASMDGPRVSSGDSALRAPRREAGKDFQRAAVPSSGTTSCPVAIPVSSLFLLPQTEAWECKCLSCIWLLGAQNWLWTSEDRQFGPYPHPMGMAILARWLPNSQEASKEPFGVVVVLCRLNLRYIRNYPSWKSFWRVVLISLSPSSHICEMGIIINAPPLVVRYMKYHVCNA